MRPLFRGEGCAIDGAGISVAGNPLTRALDAVTNDQLHAQAMREGYMGGPRPMGPMMGREGPMLDAMGKPGSALDQAWGEVGHMRPPMQQQGPVLGDHMHDQLMQHMMRPPGHQGPEAGFFGDMREPVPGADWASEFSGGPPPGVGGLMRPPMPGPEWANEFAGQHMRPPGPADMEAIFQQARAVNQMQDPRLMGPPDMEAAFMEAAHKAEMEAAFQSAAVPAPQAAQAEMEAAFQQAEMEAAFAEAQSSTNDQADLAQAAQMVDMLRNSGNPKFANSQFVSFIDKVSKGDLQFKDNTVIDRDGNTVDWDTLYDTQAATASDSDRRELEQLWAASGSSEAAALEGAWRDGDPSLEDVWNSGLPTSERDLEQLWKQAGLDMEGAWDQAGHAAMFGDPELAMDQIWTSAGRDGKEEYSFASDNPYLDSADPLAEAQRLLREGRDREALLAFEAEVQRNPESSEGWRQLGELYAQLDQDVEAIQCLRKGHEVDPYNLDSLLALGVSCTNELDRLPALRYLRMWIENHEEHQHLVHGLEMPAEYEYEAWRRQVTSLFEQAATANPLDADVFVALGVLENINHNYDAAVRVLSTACRLRPNDHTVWNKLGATLANSGKSEQAVVAYHQCLQLKPNYARSWSNLAIAHANLGQHADAARFYLSSLVLNPDAVHIWNFLHTAVLNMNTVDAFDAIDHRDLARCSKLIDGVLDPEALPKPCEFLQQPADEILATIGL